MSKKANNSRRRTIGPDKAVPSAFPSLQNEQKSPPDDLRSRLGFRIKERRQHHGLSQQQFAERCALTQSQVSELENGKSSPTVDTLASVCDALNIRITELLYEAEATAFNVPSILPFSRLSDSYDSRLGQWALAKHCLAEFVASLFRNDYRDQLVGIDGGTTNQFLADSIGRDVAKGHRTVSMIITNHIGVPERVSTGQNAPNVFVTAGVFRSDRKTLIGPRVAPSLKDFDIAASVVGVNGFRFPSMFTKAGMEDDLKNAFMSQSRNIIVPIDPSKWNQVSGTKFHSVQDLVVKENKRVVLIGAYPLKPVVDNDAIDEIQTAKITNAFRDNAQELITACRGYVELSFATIQMMSSPSDLPQISVSKVDASIESLDQVVARVEFGAAVYGVVIFTLSPRP